MSFHAHCKGLGIDLTPDDMGLIKWKLRMLPECDHRKFLETYVAMWLDVIEKHDKNNVANPHTNARAKCNHWVRRYR